MDLIVSVDENWGIGNNGQLLAKISSDLKRFRKMTTGNIIIMGRKTLESFPEGKPLPNRINIVMTHSQEYTCEGVKVCHNVQEVLRTIHKEKQKYVFVVGGASIYQQFLQYCERAYVTKIYQTFVADTYFKNLDKVYHWKLIEQQPIQEENGIKYAYLTYENQQYQQNAVKQKIV